MQSARGGSKQGQYSNGQPESSCPTPLRKGSLRPRPPGTNTKWPSSAFGGALAVRLSRTFSTKVTLMWSGQGRARGGWGCPAQGTLPLHAPPPPEHPCLQPGALEPGRPLRVLSGALRTGWSWKINRRGGPGPTPGPWDPDAEASAAWGQHSKGRSSPAGFDTGKRLTV